MILDIEKYPEFVPWCINGKIYRKEDLFCWKYAKKGFFNFKKNIPLIIEKIIKTKDFFI